MTRIRTIASFRTRTKLVGNDFRRWLCKTELETLDTEDKSKLILCVRTDLEMSKEKIAVQAGHATLGVYSKAKRVSFGLVRRSMRYTQSRIALGIKDDAEAEDLERKARAASLPTYVVRDAGRARIGAVREKFERGLEEITDNYETRELDCAC